MNTVNYKWLIGIVLAAMFCGFTWGMSADKYNWFHTHPATENATSLDAHYYVSKLYETRQKLFESWNDNNELTANLTAAQSRIKFLESLPPATVVVTNDLVKIVTEYVPTIPPDQTIIWQADGSSDNFTYSEFYTLTQVEEYIASCNLTVSGNCYEWMMALAERARHDGKPIGLALMERERADGAIKEAHFTNFVIIGKKVLRIEPQTGQVSNWDGWRLAIP